MTRNEVMNNIKMLACSQGFYGRMLRDIEEAEANGEDLTEFFEQFNDCKDPVDMILLIEQ